MIEKIKQKKVIILIISICIVALILIYIFFVPKEVDSQYPTGLNGPTSTKLMDTIPVIDESDIDLLEKNTEIITEEIEDKISDEINETMEKYLSNIQPNQLNTGIVESMLGEIRTRFPVTMLQDPQFTIKEIKNFSSKKAFEYQVKAKNMQYVTLEFILSGSILEDYSFRLTSGTTTYYAGMGISGLLREKYGEQEIDEKTEKSFLTISSIEDVKRIFQNHPLLLKLEDGKEVKVVSIGGLQKTYDIPSHKVVIEYIRNDKPKIANEPIKNVIIRQTEFRKDSYGQWESGARSIQKSQTYSDLQKTELDKEKDAEMAKLGSNLQTINNDFNLCNIKKHSIDIGFGAPYVIDIKGIVQGKCKIEHYYMLPANGEIIDNDLFTKKMTCMYDVGQGSLSYEEQSKKMLQSGYSNCVGSLAQYFRGE